MSDLISAVFNPIIARHSANKDKPVNAKVVRNLRIKFVLINMLLAVLVLFSTFAMVCYLNYASSVDSIYRRLDVVLERACNPSAPQVEGVHELLSNQTSSGRVVITNDNRVIDPNETTIGATDDERGGASSGDGGSQSNASSLEDLALDEEATEGAGDGNGDARSSGAQQSSSEITPPLIGDVTSVDTMLVAVYAVSTNGIYTSVPAYTTATMSEGTLLRANDAMLRSVTNRGILNDLGLVFERIEYKAGYMVAYTDSTPVNAWQDLAKMLVGIGLGALVVFFLINIFFSKWAVRPIADAFRQQQQFTADASHELKTPLTVILANMAILESQPNETVSSQIQWVESTQTEAERMQLLVNDMLNLVRPKGTSQAAAELQRLDFSDLVEGEVLQFESVAFELGIELESDITEDIFVKGDAERLGRMTATLIDNACKYSEEGGTVSVALKTSQPSSMKSPVVQLTVHNDGATISEEDLPHLFDRFYRADKARTSSKGGYGLGLAIGRQIAHEHDGDIVAESSEEEGTTFTVTLPLSE